MNKKALSRLTNYQFMHRSSIRIFHQFAEATVATHWHEFYELSFILAGEGTHNINGTEYPFGKGTIFLLTPADFHKLTPLPSVSLEIYNLIFSDDLLGEELRQLLFATQRQYVTSFSEGEFDQIKAAYSKIEIELTTAKVGQQLLIQSQLTAILVELRRKCSPTTNTNTHHNAYNSDFSHPTIHKALIYIQHHFREEFSLQDIAAHVQLNPNYFSECFKKATNTTFQTYLINLRLNFAASLLRVSQLPITEICYASGFNTLSHFERLFKQKFNQTPNDYRKKIESSNSVPEENNRLQSAS